MYPANKNYTLGKGKLYFDKFLPGTTTGTGQRYFGNTPEINLTSESETLDHYDSDGGVRQKDDSVLLQLTRTGSFTTDHISPANLALFFLGSETVLTQASATAQTTTISAVKRGMRYQLGVSTANPAGARGVTNVTIAGKVLGTDFTVDAATGGIVILESGSIAEGSSTTVTFDAQAVSYNRVVTAANAQIEGSLFYVANNPKGDNFDYYWPKVVLRPDGDFALKTDEWQTLSFSFEAAKRDDNTEILYINGRPGVNVT